LVDVAFGGAYRQRQSLGDCAVGQAVGDEHHDLAFAGGQRKGFAGLAKRRGAGAPALLGQRVRPCRASQCRSAQAVAAIRQGGVGGRVHGPDKVTHALEFL